MTSEPVIPQRDPDIDRLLTRAKAFDELCRSVVPENKRALFDALAKNRINAVIVEFDGGGDSGQIESIEVQGAARPSELPSDTIEIAFASWDDLKAQHKTVSLHEVIEEFVYHLLRETHRGWENNEGAYGTFTFDVGKRTILLEFNERHIESDYSEHEF